MVTETKHYRLANKITDESFELQKLANYHLYLAIGKQVIRAAVADTVRNKFILLEDYELSNIFTPLQAAQQVQDILQGHAFFKLSTWKEIRVAIKNQSFTLVPEALFDPKAEAERGHAGRRERVGRARDDPRARADALELRRSQSVDGPLAGDVGGDLDRVRVSVRLAG